MVWTDGPRQYSHDLRTRRTSAVRASRKRHVVDVHDEVEVFGVRGTSALRAPALAEKRFPDPESHVRLSPSGNYVLAVEGTDARHAAAIVDTRTGDLWRVPRNTYVATRAASDDPWSAPVNLGQAVNTSAGESRPSLSWDAHTLLFGRAPGPEGMSDIYLSTR